MDRLTGAGGGWITAHDPGTDLPVRHDSTGQAAVYDPNEVVFMDFGACKGQDPRLFNTETNHGKTSLRGIIVIGGRTMRKREQVELARSICRSCPVLRECAAFITRYPEGEGIWAGTIPEERAGNVAIA